jgi:Tol biopolymer transport system component
VIASGRSARLLALAWLGAASALAQSAPASRVLASVTRQPSARNVTSTADQNEWNPRFSPDGKYLSFERRNGAAQALFVLEAQGPSSPQRVSSQPPKAAASAEEALLGGGAADSSFNAQIAFYPDPHTFVFTGNGGSGVYRLYKGTLGSAATQTLTVDSKEDGHPAVSPDGRFLVYVSARGGIGKLILRDLAAGTERQLTKGDKVDLYPAWSPDSRWVAYTSGDNDNHDAFVIDALAPEAAPRALTAWKYDDLRPTFSPDGRLIAFYSNYSPSGEDKEWSIVVVPADGTGPTKGSALAKRALATNVVTDPEIGPAWLPDGKAIAFARNIKAEWNPIFVVDVETGEDMRIETQTRMNHDLACSRQGLLAFRAQVATWDDIFVVPLVRTGP